MSPELYRVAIDVASKLRVEGRTVDLILEEKKAKWVFKHASRTEAKYCVIVAEDEYANGEVQVKDLADGGQRAVRIDALGEWAKETFTSTS
jgi:histidyl-tRNA synthetase